MLLREGGDDIKHEFEDFLNSDCRSGICTSFSSDSPCIYLTITDFVNSSSSSSDTVEVLVVVVVVEAVAAVVVV